MQRPIEPQPGQESVWSYPRPPRLEPCAKTIRIVTDGITIAETSESFRVLETSHPPVFYLPPGSVRLDLLEPSDRASFCEWKGKAKYFSLNLPERRIDSVAWAYPTPTERFRPIAGYLAFYPSRVDACFVDGEQVQAQEGDFYGGWITGEIIGPFKGGPGTRGW